MFLMILFLFLVFCCSCHTDAERSAPTVRTGSIAAAPSPSPSVTASAETKTGKPTEHATDKSPTLTNLPSLTPQKTEAPVTQKRTSAATAKLTPQPTAKPTEKKTPKPTVKPPQTAKATATAKPTPRPEPEVKGLLKVISFNIQNRNAAIAWTERAKMLKYYVDRYQPDVMGMQEVTMGGEWNLYLPRVFDSDRYAAVGEARTNVPALGLEANLVYYRKDKYNLLDSGTFWLNETGNKGETGWNAAYPRTCTYVLLQQKSTKDTVLFMNTHLDNKSNEAKEKGFDLVIRKSLALGADRFPLVITGDMNTHEKQKNKLYQKFVSYENIGDVKYLSADSDTGRSYIPHTHDYPIDHIFVSKNNTKPLQYRVIDEAVNGKYFSDHFGIYAEIMISSF
ncbi:MAG: endonuclease/exonuclease/phosphatase family protein [Clostridia bacterium]